MFRFPFLIKTIIDIDSMHHVKSEHCKDDDDDDLTDDERKGDHMMNHPNLGHHHHLQVT